MNIRKRKTGREFTDAELKAIKIAEKLSRKMGTVAHDYKHADNVRKGAVLLAIKEGFTKRDVFLTELAGLLHDIGLDYVEDRSKHAEMSSKMFLKVFSNNNILSNHEKNKISFLILHHDKFASAITLTSDENLLRMLRVLIDADTLELLGKNGYTRAVETAKSREWPLHGPNKHFGETTTFTTIEPTLVGQLNFQASCFEMLFTESAKEKGKAGVKYIREKILEIPRH